MKPRPLTAGPAAANVRTPRDVFNGDQGRTPRIAVWLTAFMCLIVAGLFLWEGGDLRSLHQRAVELNGLTVFALVTLLPLVGVPVSPLYVLAGAKFGVAGALLATVAATAIQLLCAWWIGRGWLRPVLDFLLRRCHLTLPVLPSRDAVPACLLITMIPGLLYALKNYLLVLGGVRFRPYFWTCLPAYTFHSLLAILIGDFFGDMTTLKLVFLAAYAIIFMALSHYLLRRLRERRGGGSKAWSKSGPRSPADDPRPPG